MNDVDLAEDEVAVDIRLVINCPGITSSGLASMEDSMKESIKGYLEQTFQTGVGWQTDDGLEFYLTDAQFEWQSPQVPSLDGS